ncbi:hypothetical protein F2Q69_00036394 [Brassica cretica]|uniref:Uncharacterized protein n=1 Tax=Brassica cretica TaxID=69181 RepID=A0A8S9SD91_BRACR|nr:hypothetical protein F2Q69_00036394 [Brassica cretica]
MWKAETCWKASLHLFYALVEPSTSEVSIFFISSAPFVLHCWSCILQSVSKTLKFELMSHKCGSIYRFRDDLEECGDFGVSWSLLSAELHRRVRCLAIDRDLPNVILSSSFDTRYIFELAFQCHRFEVNQHPVADVMPVLLKSGQSASQEKAVEEMKDCRSTTQHWCRSTVMPEYGLSIFYDR